MQNEYKLGAKLHSMTNGCELNCTFGSTWHEEVAKVIEKK